MKLRFMMLCLLLSAPGAFAEPERLKPCPSSPNCVSSQAAGSQYIAPLSYAGAPEQAWQRLQETIKSMKRVKIVTATGSYLHAEFRTALFRFTDDVEFLMNRELKHIDVRSASRKGHSDLGVNRRRVEHIRTFFNAPTATPSASPARN